MQYAPTGLSFILEEFLVIYSPHNDTKHP